jgi:hypothetical protein
MAEVRDIPKGKFANHELVTIATLLLGGETKSADLEDIAMKVNQLAPGRFAWRKYPAQINIKSVDDALRDAKKLKNGRYVLKSSKEEWLLTAGGLAFARQRIRQLEGADVSRKPMGTKERNWVRRERERLLGSDAYGKFAAGKPECITAQEAEAFFRIDAYVTGEARSEKLLRASNVFGEDPELGPLIKLLIARIEQGAQ